MLTLILWVALIGAAAFFLTQYVPMHDAFKKGIYVLAVIFVLLLVLNAFGVQDQPVPKLR